MSVPSFSDDQAGFEDFDYAPIAKYAKSHASASSEHTRPFCADFSAVSLAVDDIRGQGQPMTLTWQDRLRTWTESWMPNSDETQLALKQLPAEIKLRAETLPLPDVDWHALADAAHDLSERAVGSLPPPVRELPAEIKLRAETLALPDVDWHALADAAHDLSDRAVGSLPSVSELSEWSTEIADRARVAVTGQNTTPPPSALPSPSVVAAQISESAKDTYKQVVGDWTAPHKHANARRSTQENRRRWLAIPGFAEEAHILNANVADLWE